MLASNETVILEVLRQALNAKKLTTACFKNLTPPSKPVVKKRVEKELLEVPTKRRKIDKLIFKENEIFCIRWSFLLNITFIIK